MRNEGKSDLKHCDSIDKEGGINTGEHKPHTELKMKLGKTKILGSLADSSKNIDQEKVTGYYIALIEAESIAFEKRSFLIELHKPDDLYEIIKEIKQKNLLVYEYVIVE